MASVHKKKLRSGKVVWELTHGRPPNRVRFIAGKTKEEAERTLALFKRQLAVHGTAPGDVTLAEAVRQYREYLRLNRSPATTRRYGRVLATFAECYLPQFHPGVSLLRDVKPSHLEEYKARRLEGGIAESAARIMADEERKDELRRMQQEGTKAPSKGIYGVLGARHVKEQVSRRTVNYELEALRTFSSGA
jgi:hypothetical protein